MGPTATSACVVAWLYIWCINFVKQKHPRWQFTSSMRNCDQWWKRSISVYLLKGYTADLYCLWDTFLWFWSQKQIALMLTVSIASSKTIGKLRTDAWIVPVSEELIAFLAPLSLSTQVWSCRGRHLSRGISWVCLLEVSVMEQILWNKFPGNWASMHEQCVPSFFFSPMHKSLGPRLTTKQCGVVVCELTYLVSLSLLTG